jgi:azurin
MKIYRIISAILLLLTLNVGNTFAQREIKMDGTDDMKYSVVEIKTIPGEELKVTLKSISTMPADAMAHNFVLLKKNTDAMSFITDGMGFKDNDYISTSWEDVILVKSEMVAVGKQTSVTFKAPTEKGKYEYVCTFPGHYLGGMKGFLIVE